MTTILPTDANDNAIPALRLKDGGGQSVAVTTGSSVRNAAGFSTDTKIVSIYATDAVYLRFGENDVVASSSDHYFPGGVYYDFAIGGYGVDRRAFFLGGQFDFVTMVSNGAEWFVTSSNRMAGNTRFYDGSGLYDVDMAVDVYFVSSFGGALEVRLPPANATEAIGRTVTIKKTDTSSNVVTVSEQGGSGPDGFNQPLSSQYEAITVVSDGGQWFITSKF